MLRLRNSLFPLLRAASPLPSPIHCCACRLLSTATFTTIVPAPFSLEDYLIASCDLAPAQARKVSKKVSQELSRGGSRRPLEELSYGRLISASNPDAILALLSGAGLSRDNVVAVVSADPLLLRASVKNIAPRLLNLRDRVLVAIKRCMGLLTMGLERAIKPNIALLNQWGVRDIAKLCSNNPWVLTFNPKYLKEVLLRAEELGVPTTSPMFRQAVDAVASISKEKAAAKLEFFKRTLGCSESEVYTGVSKIPKILDLSDEILLRKIEFLVNEAMMEPRYIVERPVLLAYSLEKRLVPRHYVMKVLQEKGMLNSNMRFFSLTTVGEETFKSKFIDCHKDSVPGLADAYAAACAGFVLSRV